MKTTNENSSLELKNETENKILSIFCFDEVSVKARVTFDSCVVQGVQVTFWMDDDDDVKERVSSIFGLLFEEAIKAKKGVAGINN